MHTSPPLARGTSLIELLVVIGIMGIMMSLLLPALNSAREAANETVCKNNLYQVNLAMRSYKSAYKRLPPLNQWTIGLLPFLEEIPLAQALRTSNPAAVPAAKTLPVVYSCTAQPSVISKIVGMPICHYLLVIDAPAERRGDRKISWGITDRPKDLPEGKLAPWYVGPEMHPLEFQRLARDGQGPHRGGVFFP